jgi:hypothetical protein
MRVQVRSVEQPVNLEDDDDVYNWPFIYAATFNWRLTDSQVAKLRDYLDCGGFLICDDFWGDAAWQVFTASMSRVYERRHNARQQRHTPSDAKGTWPPRAETAGKTANQAHAVSVARPTTRSEKKLK